MKPKNGITNTFLASVMMMALETARMSLEIRCGEKTAEDGKKFLEKSALKVHLAKKVVNDAMEIEAMDVLSMLFEDSETGDE